MILNHRQIQACIDLQDLITGSSPAMLNGTSVDVRLGPKFMVEQPHPDATADDELGVVSLQGREPLNFEEVVLEDDEPLLLYPGQFVLAATSEQFKLPLDLSAEFRLKSSAGRMGLSHALAVWCDPGWSGALTLELYNMSQHHVVALRSGDRIGQMIFHVHEAVRPGYSYATKGVYNGDTGPAAARPPIY